VYVNLCECEFVPVCVCVYVCACVYALHVQVEL
jgi:hypothetical protein